MSEIAKVNAHLIVECDDWDWEEHTIRRETGLVEHACPHGIGHPNPGSALWIAEGVVARRAEDEDWDGDEGPIEDIEGAWMVHGCDGCCSHESFPDFREALIFAHRIIRNQHQAIAKLQEKVGD